MDSHRQREMMEPNYTWENLLRLIMLEKLHQAPCMVTRMKSNFHNPLVGLLEMLSVKDLTSLNMIIMRMLLS
jgi:hypothetical protein